MKQTDFIPILTTPAGNCLTFKNWQECGIETVSYHLSSLLVKPGLHYMQQLQQWSDYLPWDGKWVLNASALTDLNKQGHYVIQSSYDGSKINCSIQDIARLMIHLKPTLTLLPSGFYTVNEAILAELSASTSLFVPTQEVDQYSSKSIEGIYGFSINKPKDIKDLTLLYYAIPSSELDFNTQMDSHFLETDFPSIAAFHGKVFTSEGMIDLTASTYANQFEVIDSNCDCPTCQQKLTRAYLHHLLENTPLLCQRFLIQHNWYHISANHLLPKQVLNV